ncbi:MAG: hypothetical protein EP330_00110 [Deltaproteobacteria bacterium]|nr:MAG: hypothetical protein EP330_00110 [Deltaproteobacteria bacterium]
MGWILGAWLCAGCAGTQDETDLTDEVDSAATDSAEATDSGGADSGEPELASWNEARPIIEARCSRCHTADRLCTYRRLETHADVSALRSNILDKISAAPSHGQRMPLVSTHTHPSAGCEPTHPQLNDRRLTDAEMATLVEYLGRTDHLEYDDTHAPLTPPVVPELAGSVAYTSTQFDVINDGFLDPPGGPSDDYMHDYGYDERDYDQMEDDWFCIAFDPARVDPGFLTGIQVQTESGQIYLNSQLYIDTSGGFATARQAATERGTDWYRCDAGLGFADAVPLWRTVPGGEAVELPSGVGLRFEPGWTFVLRADFHTHYDADEFNRLEQNGVIDYDAGTMTWFNRATVRARWAAPSEVSREMSWMAVGPSTQAERDAFAVVPGQSQLTYSATVPTDPAGSFAVFSAEVGMGKNGRVASLAANDGTCIANNANFSPKWIEQALYAESDAPVLDAGDQVDLRCDYMNGTQDPVLWGAEGEATVWGRKERCSALVFYYPQSAR